MSYKLTRREQGFTIIEVMIVLAIAALILLAVFLAVPNLQRNSRNTNKKGDIGRVATALNNWESNNNGTTFTAGVGNANLTSVINDAGTLSQYTLAPAAAIGANSFTVVTGTQAAMPPGANNVNLGSVQVVTGADCGTSGATVATSSTRSLALQYLLESGGGNTTAACLDVQ
jgi:prepilin-type N-terminal cleavage/methylation domain-containing protein